MAGNAPIVFTNAENLLGFLAPFST